MLAQVGLEPSYKQWNAQHGAPFGRPLPLAKQLKSVLPASWYWRLRGPFSIQPNNTTRAFEYPWAFREAATKPGMRVLEIGGSLSGFQFALDRAGCEVVNVDPGMEAVGKGWLCNPEMIARLNGLFGANVTLKNTTIDQAALPSNSFDRAFSISVIEHLPWEDVQQVMLETYRCLKPGGLFILTVDLFMDIAPFAAVETNKYGRNMDVKAMVDLTDFELVTGETSELHGFEAFNADHIAAERNRYLMGLGYPALVQCLTLRKPS